MSDPTAALAAFSVARVIEAKPHPDADPAAGLQRANQGRRGRGGLRRPQRPHRLGWGIRAVGVIHSGHRSEASQIENSRVESNGMLLSEREVGLSDEHDGIIELDDDLAIGEPFAKVLGLDDPVIDIAITPNRQIVWGFTASHGTWRRAALAR